MQKEIKEYADALDGMMIAQKSELKARVDMRKAHYRLRDARDALRAKETEMLEAMELQANNIEK